MVGNYLKSQVLLEQVINRKIALSEIVTSIEKELATLPEGNVSIRKKGKYYRCFYTPIGKGKTQEYISKSNENLVELLVQREYDLKLQERVLMEISYLQKMEEMLGEESWIMVKDEMQEEKKGYVKTPVLSDGEYIEKWLNQEYTPGKMYEDEKKYESRKGENMRSKSEVIIADILDEYRIPYLYEKPLRLKSGRVVYPDFTILDIRTREEIYWEHFGRGDDPYYMEKNIEKINEYEKNGYYIDDKLYLSFETSRTPLDIRNFRKRIKKIFYS